MRKADLPSLPDFTTGENSPTFHQHIGSCAKASQCFSIFIDSSMRQSAANENFRIDLTLRDIVEGISCNTFIVLGEG